MKEIIFASLLAFTLSISASFLMLKFFPKWGLMDKPWKYGHKRKPIPYPAGIAMPIIFSIILLFFLPFDKHLFALVFGTLSLAIVAFVDDRKGLNPIFRLSFQVFIALVVIACGIGIEVISNPLGGHFELNQYSLDIPINSIDYQITLPSDLFTIIWIIIMINTLNWLDGVVGLSAGTSAAGGLTLGILSLTPLVNQPEIALIAFVFAFVALGFLPFNIAPPKMLLGDAGAMPLGFILAMLAIFSGGKVATAFLVLALPVLDAFWVALYRMMHGKMPWKGQDKAHLHDRLLMLNWNKRQIFFLFFLTSVFLGSTSLFLGTTGKGVVVFILLLSFFIFRFQIERKLQK